MGARTNRQIAAQFGENAAAGRMKLRFGGAYCEPQIANGNELREVPSRNLHPSLVEHSLLHLLAILKVQSRGSQSARAVMFDPVRQKMPLYMLIFREGLRCTLQMADEVMEERKYTMKGGGRNDHG